MLNNVFKWLYIEYKKKYRSKTLIYTSSKCYDSFFQMQFHCVFAIIRIKTILLE